MQNPNIIPLIKGFWATSRSETVAIITKCSERFVEGEIVHNNGLPIPFSVLHNHQSFTVNGMTFHFKNWNF